MNNYLSYAEADELCDGMIRQYIGKDAPIPAFIDTLLSHIPPRLMATVIRRGGMH